MGACLKVLRQTLEPNGSAGAHRTHIHPAKLPLRGVERIVIFKKRSAYANRSAASRREAALPVASQVNSGSSRPK